MYEVKQMAYISNKDKKFQDKQNEEKKSTYGFKKDPSKSLTWKITNIVLILIMVGAPIGALLFLIIKACTK